MVDQKQQNIYWNNLREFTSNLRLKCPEQNAHKVSPILNEINI